MRVLLVEDDLVTATVLLLRWHERGWSVLHCPSLAEADAALPARSCDLVVLDRGLPDGDGLEWLRQLRLRDSFTPVLMLTARGCIADRVEGLQTGADDYLVKPFAVEELDARMEVLARRAAAARGEMLKFGALTWLGREGRVLSGSRQLELLPREREVLGLLIRRTPHVVSTRELTDALAERNQEVNDSATQLYISRLRRKLTDSGTSIQTVRGFGYRLVRDEPATLA